jgi:RHS repeat-associated protein
MEKDDEIKGTGNSYDFGARMLDPRVGRWFARDPKESKYPYESTYAFVGNSPLIYVDPDGKEKIVVTGGEFDGDRYKYNFIEPSIKQLKDYKAKAGTEQVTWAIMNVGYSEEDIVKFKSTAQELGVNLVLINSDKELTSYLNQKETKTGIKETIIDGEKVKYKDSPSLVSLERMVDKITDVSIFGHGLKGKLAFGYHQEEFAKFEYGIDDVKDLSPVAFNKCTFDIFTCNSATPVDGSNSLWSSFAGELASNTATKVNGYFGKSEYAFINKGESFSDKVNRKLNGFNPSGSENLPSAGNQDKPNNNKKSVKYSFNITIN